MGIEEFLLSRAKNKGHEEAVEDAKTMFVKNLIKVTDFSNERIASLVDANVAFVDKIRAIAPISR